MVHYEADRRYEQIARFNWSQLNKSTPCQLISTSIIDPWPLFHTRHYFTLIKVLGETPETPACLTPGKLEWHLPFSSSGPTWRHSHVPWRFYYVVHKYPKLLLLYKSSAGVSYSINSYDTRDLLFMMPGTVLPRYIRRVRLGRWALRCGHPSSWDRR